jgi:hypothetical protein
MYRRKVSFLLVVTLLVGCTAENPTVTTGTSHVRLLTMLYNKATRDLGHVPKDEQEFKDQVKRAEISPESLKVNSIDELFISERDGQPLQVVYGTPPKGSDVVVYEQIGVDGKRMVGHRIGMVEEVDDAKFKELVSAPPGK